MGSLRCIRRFEASSVLSVSFKFVTMKTAFLLTLASGQRRSEDHDMSGAKHGTTCLQNKSIQLKFLTDFRAQNQYSEDSSPMVLLRSLSAIVGKDNQDRLICRVRCLRFYLDRSQEGDVRSTGVFYFLYRMI